jgi:MHS family shikimate/dehydroshikimate transporter-like MFS transporter
MTDESGDVVTGESSAPQIHVGRVVLASFVGTMIEWYDFFLYGIATTLVFDRLFFPSDDEFVSRMAALGSFAIGFFMRPLGGIVFGHFGDRVGRKAMLVTTLLMMGLATFTIGLLPTYESIGVAAPILLVLCRLVQGLGVGGEWGGAVLMAVEHGHAGRRGFYGSCVQMGVPAGLLLATAVFSIFSSLPEEQFLSWGWRIPFLLGILLLGVGMFIRLQVFESPLFAESQKKRNVSPLPILEVFRNYRRSVLLAVGARFAENVCFYIFTVYILTYATDEDFLDLPRQTILNGILIAAAVQLVVIPLSGIISDRVGRRPVYLAGAVFVLLFAFPFFWLIETRQTLLIWLSIVLALIGHALMYGPQAAFFSELFGTRVRYSGASVGYQLASPLAGGIAPMIAAALVEWSGGATWPVSVYMIFAAGVTLVSILLATETAHTDISDENL